MAIKQQKLGISHHTLVNSDFAEQLNEQIFSPAYWQQQDAVVGQAKGRGTSWFVQGTEHQQWVLRHYRRGGLIGKLLSDQFLFAGWSRTRPFAEFKLLMYMQEQGLNVPVPVAAAARRSGLIYRADLLTVRIPGAQDLHQVLTQQALDTSIWRHIGASIKKMHNAQVYHHDLNIRNIMLDTHYVAWIIDFDRCAVRRAGGWKQANLDRLHRSFVKEQQRSPELHWQADDWSALVAGYNDT